MSNSELFIDTYNKLDKYLRKRGKYNNQVSFSFMVKDLKMAAIKRHRDEIFQMSSLRNVIVHNPKSHYNNKAIAEPHDFTVQRMLKIYNDITKPKKVYPTFGFEVLGAKLDDKIIDIMMEMKRLSFSQFPVFDENGYVVELINNNTISRWLCENFDENGDVIAEDVKVGDLISEIEFKNNYRFISKDESIFEAYDMFIKQINANKRNLDVIFITPNGKQKENLIGLITIEDIATEV